MPIAAQIENTSSLAHSDAKMATCVTVSFDEANFESRLFVSLVIIMQTCCGEIVLEILC